MIKLAIRTITISLILLSGQQAAIAWDSVGHRVTAAVALEYPSDETQGKLLDILAAHPRFEADFIQQMPVRVRNSAEDVRIRWLLGQAAYWPDIARGLPEAAAQRYNRPAWHYIDGAWVRGAAAYQGNTYIGIEPFADFPGALASNIASESSIGNIMTALDFNTQKLIDTETPIEERAVALCWVLHLIGDIHQPLHTGSLFSAHILADGDRGGNAIATDSGNLHADWDRAISADGLTVSLTAILETQTGFTRPRIQGVESDWSEWMTESRQLLQFVYTPAIESAIASADATQSALPPINLDADYRDQMQRIALQRIGLAGVRLAIWFENEGF